MNPRDYFMKSENVPNAVTAFVNSSKMIRLLCKKDGKTWEICRVWWGQSNEQKAEKEAVQEALRYESKAVSAGYATGIA